MSLSTENRAHIAYDQGGLEALKPKPIGGRKRENMTLEDEKALLARFAKAAGAGEMLNIHDLEAAYEKAIGHETSKSTIYNLLARHGWRKLMPRPFHDATSRLRTLLKKWLSKCSEESQAGGRLRILFADEARFGRVNRPRPCWAPIGIRPEVASQLIREYIYLYGAVSPKDGTCIYLIMPRSDTACIQVFLKALADPTQSAWGTFFGGKITQSKTFSDLRNNRTQANRRTRNSSSWDDS